MHQYAINSHVGKSLYLDYKNPAVHFTISSWFYVFTYACYYVNFECINFAFPCTNNEYSVWIHFRYINWVLQYVYCFFFLMTYWRILVCIPYSIRRCIIHQIYCSTICDNTDDEQQTNKVHFLLYLPYSEKSLPCLKLYFLLVFSKRSSKHYR